MRTLRALPFLAAFAPALPLGAQANADPGIDVKHGPLNQLTWKGRDAPFPDGTNAFAMSTTSCNVGSVAVPWLSTDEACGGFGCGCGVMEDDHPLIAFLIARESDGRFEQVSDYSYVKHGFFALSDSQCTPCQGGSPGGDFLGVGCSDTYSHFNNGDNYWLAPAEEIDPWLGTWEVVGSFFDRGYPEVSAPANEDGKRSFCFQQAAALGVLGNRVLVADADLDVAGARYFFQGYYVIRGEPGANRVNNARSKEFVPTLNADNWNVEIVSGSNTQGALFKHWDGAVFSYGEDGGDDGRVWVGVNVVGPEDGLYRYEIALHNRDSHRKVGGLRLPVCPSAVVTGVGFGDPDADPANEWTFARSGGALSWSAPPSGANPLRWNSIYNFWFESDAAPLEGTVTYLPHDPGPGQDEIAVPGLPAPLGLFNYAVGPGCSFGTAPTLTAAGDPPQAVPGNASFALASGGHDPGAAVLGWIGFRSPFVALGHCTFYMSGAPGVDVLPLAPAVADGGGDAVLPLPIPDLPGLEGLLLRAQVLGERVDGGPIAGAYDLSGGLAVRVGELLPGCPGGMR